MRDIPLTQYRDWPDANYVNPVTRGNELLITNIFFIILVTLCVVVRMYSRLTQSAPGLDDIFILIAYVFTCGLCAIVIAANKDYGWDRHIYDVPMSLTQGAAILGFSAKLAFVFASNFTRLSLIFLYYRLIKESTTRWYRWTIHFGLIFNLCIFIVMIFLGIFGCYPVEKYWKVLELVEGTCLNEAVITMASGLMTIVADVIVTVLPIPIIMRLHMPLRDRIGVVVLLCTGFIVIIAGTLRTVFIWQALAESYDESWDTYPLWICAAVEIDLAVICACVPSMKAVVWKPFQKWSGKIYSQFSSANRDTKNEKSGIELTSQDPIVEDTTGADVNKGYRLTSMDFGRPDQDEERNSSRLDRRRSPDEQEEERYPIRREKATGRLPSTSNFHRSGRDPRKSSQNVDDYSKSGKLEISKETAFHVTAVSEDGSPDVSQSPTNATSHRPSDPSSKNGHPYNATAKIDWD